MKSWDVYLALSQDTHFPTWAKGSTHKGPLRCEHQQCSTEAPVPQHCCRCAKSLYGPDARVLSQEGQISVSSAVSGDLWTGQQRAGCWYCPIQLCIFTGTQLHCYLAIMPLRMTQENEEQLSLRTQPGCTEEAQKLLEMLSPTPINLSASSKISKSCSVLVVFEQPRSTNFQEHLSPYPLTGDTDLSFRLQCLCICHLFPGQLQLYRWIECKTEAKGQSWCSLSHFFMPSILVSLCSNLYTRKSSFDANFSFQSQFYFLQGFMEQAAAKVKSNSWSITQSWAFEERHNMFLVSKIL